MGKRPARCYTKVDRPPYTRKKFIKGGPDPKIRIFDLGNAGADFPLEISLFANDNAQISHNALEAARVQINRFLNRTIGRENYHFRICIYPHHYIRENKMMTGAGADRLQDGMRKAFGKPISRAARVKEGTRLLKIRTHIKNYKIAKDGLRRG
ncbi:MAG: 50S ribosomal protein L16, partial [Promethearchaeota archaeon]